MNTIRSILIALALVFVPRGSAAAQEDQFQVTAYFDFDHYLDLDAKQMNEAALQLLEKGYARCLRTALEPGRCEAFMEWMVPKALGTGNLVAAHDYAKRDIAWKKAIGHDGLAISLMQLGKILRERGDLAESLEYLDQALAQAVLRKRWYLQRYPELDAFSVTVSLDGPIFHVREQRGLTLLARREFDDAESEFAAFLAHQERSWAMLRKDFEADGDTLLESDNAGVANGLYLLAKTQLAGGNFREAERYFQRNFEKIGGQLMTLSSYPQTIAYLGEYSRAIVAQGSKSAFARTLLIKAIEGIEFRLRSISDASRNPVDEIEAYRDVFADQVSNNWRLAQD